MKATSPESRYYSPVKTLAIVERVAGFLRDHTRLHHQDSIVVAVSGGADSLALLHILKAFDLDLRLLAVYIDHGLRPLEVPGEQATIAKCCEKIGVPFLTQSVDVQQLSAQENRSTEEAARILRYAALEKIRHEQGAKWIAVGHTADDQVEHFFLRLIRGSGRKGLAGMEVSRGHLLRPLLKESKASLSDYLHYLGIAWCQDSSNLDRQILRNRIRLDLLPMLVRDFNPNISRTVLHSMDILTEEEGFFEEQTAAAFDRCLRPTKQSTQEDDQCLAIERKTFGEYHPAIRRRILEKCCWRMAVRPSYRHIMLLLDFLKTGENGREIHLDQGVRAEKQGAQLVFYRCQEKGRPTRDQLAGKDLHFPIAGPGTYIIAEINSELTLEIADIAVCGKDSDRLFLSLEKVSFPLLLRSPLPGERFHPCNGAGSKKIGRYFTDKKIPVRERRFRPVLVSAGEIIALPGLQIDHRYRITETTISVLTITWRNLPGRR